MMMIGITLGSTVSTMIRIGEEPIARAASTYCSDLSASTPLRITRTW